MCRYNKTVGRQMPARARRGGRRILLLLMGVILALALFGCGTSTGGLPEDPEDGGFGGPEGNGQGSISRNGKPVNAPVEFFYTVENPLEIISEKITEGSDEEKGIDIEHNLISISGLLDKEVEKKVNDRIMEAYEKIKSQGLPPFRGIKAAIPEDALLVSDHIHEEVMANYNNVLSVSLSRWTSYSIPDADGNHSRDESWGTYIDQQYVSVQEGLNFDLNTGEEITLADVFADNVDYLPLLNDLVTERLNMDRAEDENGWGQWYSGKLTAPFKGLSSDQKFFLVGRGVYLIIDYVMPEFYTQDFTSWAMDLGYLDMDKTVAVTKRFYDEDKNIYEAQPPFKKSLLDSGRTVPLKKQEYTNGRIIVYDYVKSSPHFPEKLRGALLEEAILPQKEIDTLNRIIKNDMSYSDGEGSGYFEQQISGGLAGRYATLTKNLNGGAGEYWFFDLKYRTWDAKTGKELTISDMFREGFDYRTLLRKAFKKSIEENGGLYLEGRELSPEESEQQLDKALSSELSFAPGSDYLWITAGEVEFPGRRREPLFVSLSFDEIGCENLAVFDDE